MGQVNDEINGKERSKRREGGEKYRVSSLSSGSVVRKFLFIQLPLLFSGILLGALSNSILQPTFAKSSKNQNVVTTRKIEILNKTASAAADEVEEGNFAPLGWAKWSTWSSCSKSCGRGVQYQLRRCMDIHCPGVPSRHRICELSKNCGGELRSDAQFECDLRTKTPEFRAQVPKRKRKQTFEAVFPLQDHWFPITTTNNCSLSCQSKRNGEIRHFGVSLKDGAKCLLPNAENAACHEGKCQVVGCDGVIGSTLHVDQCGRCGGDGLGCEKQIFRWKETQQYTPCDKTCGPNSMQVSVSVCVNTLTRRVVPERLCADQPRPRPQVQMCPYIVCPAKWLTSGWADCSVSCGVGHQLRDVFCVEVHFENDVTSSNPLNSNSTTAPPFLSTNRFDSSDTNIVPAVEKNAKVENRKVADQYCWQIQKPISERKCGIEDCPKWRIGDWSACSASCGKGVRKRNVECRQMNTRVDEFLCEAVGKPISTQPCYTGTSCPKVTKSNAATNSEGGVPSPFSSSWRRDVTEDGTSRGEPTYSALKYLQPSLADNDLAASDGAQFAASGETSKPRFYAGPWATCSVSCGTGIRSRIVECVAFQGVTVDVIKLPDYECEGQMKPTLFQPCHAAPCTDQFRRSFAATNGVDEVAGNFDAGRENSDAKFVEMSAGESLLSPQNSNGSIKMENSGFYRWDYGEWGPCSASCLGGEQKSTLKCMDLNRKITVSSAHCDSKQRPIEMTRSCNKHTCPPDWEIGEFSECSHSCGGGLRTRRVRCTRSVSRYGGAESTLILPEAQCSALKPKAQEPCGMVDCPPTWKLGKWSECSALCGAGEQRRDIICEQRDAFGTLREFTTGERCLGENLQRPFTVRLCNLGPCSIDDEDFLPRAKIGTASALALRAPFPGENWASHDNSVNGWNETGRRRHVINHENDNEADDSDNDTGRYNAKLSRDDDETGDDESNFDQSHPNHRKLTLDVGGFANLYEGTSIKVKCPVRNFSRDKIFWTKDGLKIVNNAHIKVSTNGALRVFHARMEDAGLYTCFANGARGNVTLSFKHHVPDAQHSTPHRPKSNGDGKKQQILSSNHTGKQPKSNKTKSKSKAAKEGAKNRNESSNVKFDNEILQKIKNSLYRLGEHRVYERLNSVKDPAAEVKLDFAVGEWSACSQLDCSRPDGAQVRMLKCRIYVGQLMAYVDGDEICEAFGVVRPPATRACHDVRCPRWEAGEWTSCADSRCLRHGTALQRRTVKCLFGNGTKADFEQCDRKNRPKIKKECLNVNCTAEWRPSLWGKCSKSCGDGGVQMRLLRCVWHGTRKAAGRHCSANSRPAAIRMCDAKSLKLSKCPANMNDENNTNKFWRQEEKSESKNVFSPTISSSISTTLSYRSSLHTDNSQSFNSQSAATFNDPIESSATPSSTPDGPGAASTTEGVLDYAEWKRLKTTNAFQPRHEDTRDARLSAAVEPFKGWERWRGWRLYNWPQPALEGLRRLDGAH